MVAATCSISFLSGAMFKEKFRKQSRMSTQIRIRNKSKKKKKKNCVGVYPKADISALQNKYLK